jgi:hypothetical protein
MNVIECAMVFVSRGDAEGAENPRYLYSRSLLRLDKSFHVGGLHSERGISVRAKR